jgi:hypothetical protein
VSHDQNHPARGICVRSQLTAGPRSDQDDAVVGDRVSSTDRRLIDSEAVRV